MCVCARACVRACVCVCVYDEGRYVDMYIYLYLYNTNSVCLCVCVCVSVKYRRPNCWTDHDQIWHAYADRPGDGSYQILAP